MPGFMNDFHKINFNKYWPTKNIRENILMSMKNYGIKSSILTVLHQCRNGLIIKEKTKQAYKGELKNCPKWASYEVSVNNDLESLLKYLGTGDTIKEQKVRSFFLPKLTDEELKALKERKSPGLYDHLRTNDPIPIWSHFVGDINPEEMKKSKSSDRYLRSKCWRWTVPLNLKIDQTSPKRSADTTVDKSIETSEPSFEEKKSRSDNQKS